MPIFISSLLSALAALFRSRIGAWFAAAMVYLGVALATHEFVVDPWIDDLTRYTNGSTVGGEWGPTLVAYAGVMKFDVACTMIASAVVAKYAVGAAKAFFVKTGA